MKAALAVFAVLMFSACSGPAPVAATTPSVSPTAAAVSPAAESPSLSSTSPSPSPSALPAYSPVPSPVGTPVARQVLAPAQVMPVATLCSTPLTADADGNVEPRFCRDGSINVLAWRKYTSVSPNILSAGRDATVDQIHAAFRADGAYRPTPPMEQNAYYLAAAYYGWHFSPDPSCWLWNATTC